MIVSEVGFEDNSVWQSTANAWSALGEQDKIEDRISDVHIKEQYYIEYGINANRIVKRVKDIWFCACGAINHEEEKVCHKCNRPPEYYDISDVSFLENRAKEKADEEIIKKMQKKRKRKFALIITCIAIGLVCCGALIVTKVVYPYHIYSNAKKLYDEGEYLKAKEYFKSLGGYKDSDKWIEQCDYGMCYESAKEKISEKNYKDAYEILENLNYKDSEKYRNAVKAELEIDNIRNTGIGETVMFGSYEQDNDLSNGKEELEWIVYNKGGYNEESDKYEEAYLISKYVIDCKPYDKKIWEKSNIKKWLNEDFFEEAFNLYEQEFMLNETYKDYIFKVSFDSTDECKYQSADQLIDVYNAPKYHIKSVEDIVLVEQSMGKVFLMGALAAWDYITSEANCCEGVCYPTDYAEAQGALAAGYYKTSEGKKSCTWWLRNSAFRINDSEVFDDKESIEKYLKPYYVSFGGDITEAEVDNNDGCGIRPVIVINLESDPVKP